MDAIAPSPITRLPHRDAVGVTRRASRRSRTPGPRPQSHTHHEVVQVIRPTHFHANPATPYRRPMPSLPLIVRPLAVTDADITAYVHLRREMLEHEPFAFGSSPEDDRLNADFLRTSLRSADSALIGCFKGGHLIAVAGLVREPKLKARHLATIYGVYTTPAARGLGAARDAVTHAIAIARTWPGVDWIQLSVSETAPIAQRLYESLGFIAWGTEPDATRVNGVGRAEIHMRMKL
jgi:ribosomal protein S18 acetylase RimI-like enzyme